jgi:hypothetical protein
MQYNKAYGVQSITYLSLAIPKMTIFFHVLYPYFMNLYGNASTDFIDLVLLTLIGILTTIIHDLSSCLMRFCMCIYNDDSMYFRFGRAEVSLLAIMYGIPLISSIMISYGMATGSFTSEEYKHLIWFVLTYIIGLVPRLGIDIGIVLYNCQNAVYPQPNRSV